MGRQKRRRKKGREGEGGDNGALAALPQSVNAGVEKGLQGLTSDSASQRATSCATIAHLFGANEHNTSLDAATLQQLFTVRVQWCVQSGTLAKLAALFKDTSRKVRLHATGAVRNIALEGGVQICDPLVMDCHAVEALLGSLTEMLAGLAVCEARDTSLYLEVLEEQLLLLAELVRHSEQGTAVATEHPALTTVLMDCLRHEQSAVSVMALAMESLHALADNNEPLLARLRAAPAQLQLLAQIAGARDGSQVRPRFFKDDANRSDKFAIKQAGRDVSTAGAGGDSGGGGGGGGGGDGSAGAGVAAAVAAATGSASPTAGGAAAAPTASARTFSNVDWFSMRLRACDLLVDTLAESHWGRAEPILKEGLTMLVQALTQMDLRYSSLAAATARAAPQVTPASGVEGDATAAAAAAAEAAIPVGSISNVQLALRILETLANWSTDTSDGDDDDDNGAGGASVAAASPAKRKFKLLAQARCLPLLIAKLQQLRGGAEWAGLPPAGLAAARTLRYRVICCVQNLALNLPAGTLGTPAHLQTLWAHSMGLLAAAASEQQPADGGAAAAVTVAAVVGTAAEGEGGGGAPASAPTTGSSVFVPVAATDDAERPDVSVSAMLIALLDRPELDDEFEVTARDVELIVRVLGGSSCAEARMNGAAVMGGLCAFLRDPALLSLAGRMLLQLCSDTSVLVAAEALNALCDGMGDDSCVEVRQQLHLADALARLQPVLEARGHNLKGLTLTEDQVERVEDVLGNLAGFIAHIRRR